MKKFQKLLGLCLIGSLLAVHPIFGADRSVMHKISEMVQRNPKGAVLLAGALLLGKYLLNTPELRVRKGATAASLALAYAAHRYYKSKPVSAIAGLASLISLYLVT